MNGLDIFGLMLGLATIILLLISIIRLLEDIRDKITERVSVETADTDVPTGDPPAEDA